MARKKNLNQSWLTLSFFNFKKLQFSIIKNSTPTFSFLFVLFLALLPTNTYAASCDQWVAEVVSAEGVVESRRTGETQWQQVSLNETFCAGDMIRVLENSRAGLAFANQPLLRLDQNSTITLGDIKEESSGLTGMLKGAASLDLIKGVAHFFSRLPRNLEVRTAFVNAGVEGTEFLITVDDTKTSITVFEGKVMAANSAGQLGLTSGQSAVTEKGKAPVLQTVVSPRDAVRWALYYPPVIYGSDPNLSINQAAQLLAVGRVDEAKALIQQTPQNSNALSLLSIIAVVQNNKEKARNLADQAIAADPESSTPRIALSYAQQANFDLAGARQSLEKAVELEPDNALAQARLAEIYSSFGELDKALATAEKAASIEPNLSRTQTVLGFAYLTQIKTTEARSAFNKAIELNQADSLPHLGLGLAKIRDGELEEGRRQIEIAASLNTNSSIIRSYLGKAYFEEKRSDLDGREYAIAKELDPNDPTPWFYDAIRKQTINRPVEALHDLQKANELNDNRAVYRSRLLLDSDLAARSASLARIYTDLGFQQRALAEGYNSVNRDPSNFSAHRFLADTYSALPRHEIARVSELLQSQLLQPLNLTPIQPWLAESNLPIISMGGVSEASFSEFNPLFNRDRVAFQAGALAGENDTYGGEAIVSGIKKRFSFSAGYSKAQTDGFRFNNDQEDDIANIFGQMELSYKTSIQMEYRYRNTDRGDTSLNFFEDDFLSDLRQEDTTNVLRLGFRHSFSPGSDLIGNFAYQDKETQFEDTLNLPPSPMSPPLQDIFTVKGDETGFNGEVQHLFRSDRFSITSGIGYVDVDGEFTYMDDLYDPTFSPPLFLFSSSIAEEANVQHGNLYLYSNIDVSENLILTVGASGDSYEDETLDKDQFNPKLGITWHPSINTTFRGAAFSTVKRTLITNQTLEPTQVAGFNQFFDDPNGTDSWVYGLGVDQKIGSDVYAGVEFYRRDLNVPYLSFAPPPAPPVPQAAEVDWEESLARAYLYWTPNKYLGLRAEYLYEEFDRDEDFVQGAKNVKTHRLPLGISYFHPSGLTAALQGTYYDQSGDFLRQDAMFPTDFTSGDDQFWVVDISLSYRLSKRYGFITVGATNLFDEEFNYQDTDPNGHSIEPSRMIYGQLTLSF